MRGATSSEPWFWADFRSQLNGSSVLLWLRWYIIDSGSEKWQLFFGFLSIKEFMYACKVLPWGIAQAFQVLRAMCTLPFFWVASTWNGACMDSGFGLFGMLTNLSWLRPLIKLRIKENTNDLILGLKVPMWLKTNLSGLWNVEYFTSHSLIHSGIWSCVHLSIIYRRFCSSLGLGTEKLERRCHYAVYSMMEKVDKEIHSSKMMCEVLNYVNGCSFQSMRDHGRKECALLSFLKATKCIYMLILPPAKNTCKEKGAQWQTARRRTHGLLCAAVLSIMCHFPSTDHLPYSFFNTMLWV